VLAEVLKLSADSPDPRFIRYAAGWLNRGSVVGIPTDTLYALAADPVNLSAVDEIFRVIDRAIVSSQHEDEVHGANTLRLRRRPRKDGESYRPR
jgi:hypothetical protein